MKEGAGRERGMRWHSKRDRKSLPLALQRERGRCADRSPLREGRYFPRTVVGRSTYVRTYVRVRPITVRCGESKSGLLIDGISHLHGPVYYVSISHRLLFYWTNGGKSLESRAYYAIYTVVVVRN